MLPASRTDSGGKRGAEPFVGQLFWFAAWDDTCDGRPTGRGRGRGLLGVATGVAAEPRTNDDSRKSDSGWYAAHAAPTRATASNPVPDARIDDRLAEIFEFMRDRLSLEKKVVRPGCAHPPDAPSRTNANDNP